MPRVYGFHVLFFQGADSDGERGRRVRGVVSGARARNKFKCLNDVRISPASWFCPIPHLGLAPRKDRKGQTTGTRGGDRERTEEEAETSQSQEDHLLPARPWRRPPSLTARMGVGRTCPLRSPRPLHFRVFVGLLITGPRRHPCPENCLQCFLSFFTYC